MFGESPIRLINKASIEGLEIPVTEVKNNAPKSFGANPEWCRARQRACSPSSCATLIQASLAWPQVVIFEYSSAGSAR